MRVNWWTRPVEYILSRITEITENYRNLQKLTEITTKCTEITSTSVSVTFISISNMLMISLKKMWKNKKKPEVAILFFL